MRTSYLASLTLAALVCCTERAPPQSEAERTDSAGVEIVSNFRESESLPRYQTSTAPLLQISSENYFGPPLYRVTDVVPLPNGGLAVASAGSHSVLVFGPAGDFVRALGREGTGPGEFRTVGAVALVPPDSLVAFDYQLGRLTFFGPAGAVGRTLDVSEFLSSTGGFTQLHGVPDGFILEGEAGLDALGAEQTARGNAYSFRLDLLGDSIQAYGPFPGREVFRTDLLMGSLPFGAQLFSGTRGDRLVIGTADVPEIREFRPDGSIARIIRWPDHEREVTDERAGQYVDHLAEREPPGERLQAREVLVDVPNSAIAPAYHELIISSSGTVWVGNYPGPEALIPETPGPARSWLLLDADGLLAGSVTTPAGFTLMAVQDDRVYGAYRDDMGVESVRVYGLETR